MTRLLALLLLTLGHSATAQSLFEAPLLAPCLDATTAAELPALLDAAGWEQLDIDSDAGAEALAASQQGFSALVTMTRAFETRDEVAQFVLNAAGAAPQPFMVAGLYERRGASLRVMEINTGAGVELECVVFARDLDSVDDALDGVDPMQGLAVAFTLEDRPGAGEDPDNITDARIDAPGRSGRLLDGRDSLRLTRFIPAAE